MKTLRLLAAFTILSQTTLSQTVLPQPPPQPPSWGQVSKADSLFSEGYIKESVAEYKKIYRSNPGDKTAIYDYACALSRAGQVDSAFKYLIITVNIEPDTRALTDPNLLALRDDVQWTVFENAF